MTSCLDEIFNTSNLTINVIESLITQNIITDNAEEHNSINIHKYNNLINFRENTEDTNIK